MQHVLSYLMTTFMNLIANARNIIKKIIWINVIWIVNLFFVFFFFCQALVTLTKARLPYYSYFTFSQLDYVCSYVNYDDLLYQFSKWTQYICFFLCVPRTQYFGWYVSIFCFPFRLKINNHYLSLWFSHSLISRVFGLTRWFFPPYSTSDTRISEYKYGQWYHKLQNKQSNCIIIVVCWWGPMLLTNIPVFEYRK